MSSPAPAPPTVLQHVTGKSRRGEGEFPMVTVACGHGLNRILSPIAAGRTSALSSRPLQPRFSMLTRRDLLASASVATLLPVLHASAAAGVAPTEPAVRLN